MNADDVKWLRFTLSSRVLAAKSALSDLHIVQHLLSMKINSAVDEVARAEAVLARGMAMLSDDREESE